MMLKQLQSFRKSVSQTQATQEKLFAKRKICLNKNNIIKQQQVFTKKFTTIFLNQKLLTVPELIKINKRKTLDH